ncbi:MAG: hypothetical protein IMF19_16890 [Proteobacteria bacterium]|nr:hypothetical protein [Pseudomonadota bacterium]
MIRLIISSGRLVWTAFSASELAICFALLSLFINQNLQGIEKVLDNEDKKEEVEFTALIFLIWAGFFLVLFVLILSFDLGVNFLEVEEFKEPLFNSQIIVFVSAPFMLLWAFSTLRSFRLRAKII